MHPVPDFPKRGLLFVVAVVVVVESFHAFNGDGK